MDIQSLMEIKTKLLEQHKRYETDNPEEYRQGILGGITVALMTIDRLMEGEDKRMSREFDEE
jgi:hypothetical protein